MYGYGHLPRRIYPFLAIALASLVLAPTALANPNVTGSASQACDTETGNVILTATFSNAGYDEGTTVTATDSGAGDLGTQGSPSTFTATVPGPDRAAGSVTFVWSHGSSGGTIVAPYEAVSGCVGPPPPTTTTTTPPPPPPPNHHIAIPPQGTPKHGTPSPRRSTPPEAKAPPAIQHGKLPFTGLPLGTMGTAGVVLLLLGGLVALGTSLVPLGRKRS